MPLASGRAFAYVAGMLKELVLSLITPCSPSAKKLGYLHEAIATWQRYRRCKEAWAPHIEQSKQFILDGAKSCESHRTALILGAGQCVDIPLEELTNIFNKVLLVDVVFPQKTRRKAIELGAECIECDIADIITFLATTDSSPLPIAVPQHFLDDDTIDLVVSANIASQLPLLPRTWLEKQGTLSEDELMDVAQGLIGAHFYYLSLFNAQIVLLTDRRYQTRNKEGVTISEKSALYGVKLPDAEQTLWEWSIAPAPELHADYGRVHQIVAQTWKSEGVRYEDIAA